ncbi:MAG: glycosyltransferase [Thermoguttaceae bacterium]|jgi:glycosyltransferase involved in cell wall biosynthesis
MTTLPKDNSPPELIPVLTQPTTVKPGAEDRTLRAAGIARVLHIINGEHYAGAERVQDLLAQCLPQCGFEIGFVCVKPKRFAELRQSQDTPLYELPMRNRLDPSPAWKIARIVRREKYGLIHSHTVRTALVGGLAARLAGVPMVYHVHSPMSRNTDRPWLNRINALVERFSLRRATRLIAVSESLKQHMIRQGFDASLISVVHNGVPTLYEVPFRGPPRGQWTLGTVSLFRPRKGIEVLLRALALMRRRGLPVRLRAVGEFESAEYEREVHALAADLGLEDLIAWPGFTGDVASELLTMDLFVLPSLFGEGLPMVLLEAMAAGVPVVATDVEGVCEAVRHGQDGIIVPPGDHQAIDKAVADVIQGCYDWSVMRQSAIERQARMFSDRCMAEGMAEVYRQVLRL